VRFDPAAAGDPFAGLCLIHSCFHFREEIFETRRAFEIECHLTLADTREVLVGVSETGQSCAAFQIDDARAWTNELLRRCVRADKDDAVAFNGDSLCFG